ncbi:MAG: DUF6265 family protein [Pseudomonadota bacterium]
MSPALLRRVFYFCLLLPNAMLAATVDDLAWMTGHWSGALGETLLDETWNAPSGGTIGAIVRTTSAASTNMIELITIREEGGELILMLQQFDADLTPRFAPAQQLKMTAMEPRSVTFSQAGPGGLKQLIYARPSDTVFQIDVTLTEGPRFVAKLTAAR